MRYTLLEIGAVSDSSSMENSTSLSGGNLGRSLGKTSRNSQTTGMGVRLGEALAWAATGKTGSKGTTRDILSSKEGSHNSTLLLFISNTTHTPATGSFQE